MADEQAKTESGSEDDLDNLIQEISEEDVPFTSNVSAISSAEPTEKGESFSSVSGSSEQCLTLELKGSIQLKLCFVSGNRKIEVVCGEDALVCRMADGTEFKIPTGFSHKQAA